MEIPISKLKVGDVIFYTNYREEKEIGTVDQIVGSQVWIKWHSGRSSTYFFSHSSLTVGYASKLDKVLE